MDEVKVVRRGKVLEITLDRPPANAINRAVSYALYEAFKELNDSPDLMVGIITGGGEKIFSAGWDLKEVASGSELSEMGEIDLGPGGIGGLTEFWGLTKPVIAAINGHAVGGGFELAMTADIIIAAENADFFLPEMQRGFLPDGGAIQRLPKLIPPRVAADLMYTGRRMNAKEAAHWGLVRDVVAPGQAMAKARELADSVADGAPLAVRALKTVLDKFEELSIRECFEASHEAWRGEGDLDIYKRMLTSEDYSEGPKAFAEKRKPVFKGC